MALLFSAVTVTAGEDEIELLVGGIPKEYDDLEGWSEFDDLMYSAAGPCHRAGYPACGK